MRTVRTFVLLIAAAAAGSALAQAEWPARVVTIEEMKATVPMRIAVPRSREKGSVKGPVVLRVHVDTQGAVRRVGLVESSGSSGHDEAAMQSMRGMRFAPKMVDGEAVDVTLVVPLHLPVSK